MTLEKLGNECRSAKKFENLPIRQELKTSLYAGQNSINLVLKTFFIWNQVVFTSHLFIIYGVIKRVI